MRKLKYYIAGKTFFFFASMILSSFGFSQTIKDGLRLMEIEKFEKAKKLFSDLYKKSPTSENAYYLGEVYYQTDKEDSAAFYFREGISRDPFFAMNYVGVGKIIYPSNAAEGKKNFDKALELSKSKNVQVLTSIAEFYINNDKLDVPRAMTLLDAAEKLDPKNPDIQILKGDAFWKIAEPTKGVMKYDDALKLNPKHLKTYLKLGYSYYRVYNYEKAMDYYRKGLALDSIYAPFYREMGNAFYKNENYDQAFRYYKKYIDMADQDENTSIRYASFLILLKEYKKAYAVVKPYEGKDKVNPFMHRIFAYLYYEMGEYDKGLQSMNKFMEKVEKAKFISTDYEYYGKLLAKKDQDSLAAVNLEKAYVLDSSRYDFLSDLGMIYFSKKNYSKAAEILEKKVKRKSSTVDLYNLGRAYYYNRDYVNADTIFGTLIQTVPDYVNGYVWKARTKASLDPESEKGLAKPYFEKVLSLTANDKEKYKKDIISSYEYLAYYYLLKKDNATAKELYTKLKEIDPSNKKAEEGLRYISGDKGK